MKTIGRSGMFVSAAILISIAVLALSASAQAVGKPVKLTFSGSNVATTINLQGNTITDEVQVAGTGSLGQFTFRELHADGPAPPVAGCAGPSFGVLKGSGVFRFQDGSLLIVSGANGSGCVDLSRGGAALTIIYQITGGSGRFEGATGSVTMHSFITPVLFNANNAPALLTNTGDFEGTLYGVDGK